jgi:hypothetical protein
MRKYLNFVSISLFTFLFSGCIGSYEPEVARAVDTSMLNKQNTFELLDLAYKKEKLIEKELFFSDSQGIIYNANSVSTDLKSKVDSLLANLFKQYKTSNNSKLNVALQVSDDSILKNDLREYAESFLAKEKKFTITNISTKDQNLLKKVLNDESDGIYNSNKKIDSKNTSDVILIAEISQEKDDQVAAFKLFAKNGVLLSKTTGKISSSQNKVTAEWIEVSVPRNDGEPLKYAVMKKPSNLSNMNFEGAEQFCLEKKEGQLITPYVFENLRRSSDIEKPSGITDKELIAPYDQDEDEAFFREGDSIETANNSIIIFHWKTEKYFEIPNLYKSRDTTFRCMKAM